MYRTEQFDGKRSGITQHVCQGESQHLSTCAEVINSLLNPPPSQRSHFVRRSFESFAGKFLVFRSMCLTFLKILSPRLS